MEPGIYCLVFENPAAVLEVGGLGAVPFRAGYHLYVGSALGPGGLVRVERHRRLERDRDRRPHWHVDRLLLDPRFRLVAVVAAGTTGRLECERARAIGGDTVAGFGASDCRCGSHLVVRRTDPVNEIVAAFQALGLAPTVVRYKNDFEKAMVTDEED
ncbi:MAG: GIY-YIG nuclease family protein [Methanospirillum sp.]